MTPSRLLLLASLALPVLWMDTPFTSISWLVSAACAAYLHKADPQWTEDAQEATR